MRSTDVEAAPLRGNEQLIIGILLCDRPVLERWVDALSALQAPVPMGAVIIHNPGQDKMREICTGRQRVVDRALAAQARYVFFLDDDVVVPSDLLVKLLRAMVQNPRARIVGGLYPQLGWKNANVPAAWDETENYLASMPMGQVIRCAGVGSGCMLLDLSVMPKLPKPWFRFEGRGPQDMRRVDDVILCNEVRRAGYDVLLHAGAVCSHLDARIVGSDFKGKSPYELRYSNGRYIDHAGNLILRSQVAH